MSWADDYLDGLEDLALQAIEKEQEVEYIYTPAWRQSNGKLIAISDMSTKHIYNCLKLIHKNKWRTQYITLFHNELLKRTNNEVLLKYNK